MSLSIASKLFSLCIQSWPDISQILQVCILPFLHHCVKKKIIFKKYTILARYQKDVVKILLAAEFKFSLVSLK